MRRTLIIGLVSVFGLGSAVADANSPNTIIEEAVAILDQRLTPNRDALAKDKAALYALIDEVLLPRFDRKFAAQLVLAKHWRGATPEQRDAFIDAYYKSMVQRYSDGLLEFDQNRVEVLPFRGDESKKRTMVKTRVLLDDGKKVPVNYGVVKRESGWLIFDVQIEGISYVKNFRAELDAEINRTSLDAVIARLQSEIVSAGD